jgi:hypothetical protein
MKPETVPPMAAELDCFFHVRVSAIGLTAQEMRTPMSRYWKA